MLTVVSRKSWRGGHQPTWLTLPHSLRKPGDQTARPWRQLSPAVTRALNLRLQRAIPNDLPFPTLSGATRLAVGPWRATTRTLLTIQRRISLLATPSPGRSTNPPCRRIFTCALLLWQSAPERTALRLHAEASVRRSMQDPLHFSLHQGVRTDDLPAAHKARGRSPRRTVPFCLLCRPSRRARADQERLQPWGAVARLHGSAKASEHRPAASCNIRRARPCRRGASEQQLPSVYEPRRRLGWRCRPRAEAFLATFLASIRSAITRPARRCAIRQPS